MLKRREFSYGLVSGLGLLAVSQSTLAAPAAALSDAAWHQALQAVEFTLQGGRLGVAMLDTGSGRSLGWREDERFPMASTFKLVLAGWMLERVDRGQESLAHRVHYERSALVAYSPVTEKHVGAAGITVGELCHATVTLSDNTAANLLLARHGGPAGLTAFVRSLEDAHTRLDRTEPTLNEAVAGDPRDTTTPTAMLHTMRKLVLGNALSPASRAQLTAWMVGNQTGDKRLRAGVPGWKVGDKTGTGSNGSSNDIGVLWPPGGSAPVLVTCYMTGVPAAPEVRDAAIAQVARHVAAAVGRAGAATAS
ncbi:MULTISPECIES: class A beta-lactamase [unclassified Acidovorax]|uniref:class A beta-lactamase n=1 Tax=unclassified Acidovorax TaxID=2684926 RepID=UPI002882F8D5|nr:MULTISPECIES: class A beta-lactamase [unclassified Acidovorax]